MAFDNNNGTLYATGLGSGTQSLYTVDTTTGTATLIGSTGISTYLVGLEYQKTPIPYTCSQIWTVNIKGPPIFIHSISPQMPRRLSGRLG